MKIRVRFFSEFGQLLGDEVLVDAKEGSVLSELIASVSGKNRKDMMQYSTKTEI